MFTCSPQAKLAQIGPSKDSSKPGEGPVSLPSGVPMAAVPAMPQPPKPQQDLFKVATQLSLARSLYRTYAVCVPKRPIAK